MPKRALKIITAVVKASKPKKMKAKSRALVRRVAQGTLLAVTLASAQIDSEESTPERKRLFDAGLLDRLRAPITRYHE
jgi:hypothetical protein